MVLTLGRTGEEYCFMVFAFVCLFSSTVVVQSLATGLIRPCAFQVLACRLQRPTLCPQGEKCTRVTPVSKPDNSTACEYICNQTDTGNLTTTTATTLSTTASWRSDPYFCSANFRCMQGLCAEEYKINGTGPPRCVCFPNSYGTFCHNNCTKVCQNNGTCWHSTNKTTGTEEEICKCPKEYNGKECEFKKPVTLAPSSYNPKDDSLWYIPVFGCLSVLLFILILYFVLQKLKWRSLFVTKLFHFFQPYEDDDGKLFDAFISFKSSKSDYTQSDDEKFVLQVLQPMLEKEFQYNVCVHYRDFLPGETIANNIIWAVENSRRTILVLSPLYVESDWARMEYQMAQQEMLQLRHKIIPVIFQDISNTTIVDPTLRHILGSVTYIHYPQSNDEKEQSKFWQMVGLALPKKRPPEGETSSTNSHPALQLTTSQTLMSQESWQSARTDITDIDMEGGIENNDEGQSPTSDITDYVTLDVNMDVNEVDKIRTNKMIANHDTLNNNADKYISILNAVNGVS